MKKIAFALALIALSGCTDHNGTQRALEDAGYSKIELKGYSFFGCSQQDTFRTEFKATGPSGRNVEGVVCSGIFKGSTIRTF